MASNIQYMMENPNEIKRLGIKTDRTETLNQLIETGFNSLPPNSKILDAGCVRISFFSNGRSFN